ncbi:MAG: hypothetical protein J3K34DRAFT_154763, partial [Monoraphidium minutum]
MRERWDLRGPALKGSRGPPVFTHSPGPWQVGAAALLWRSARPPPASRRRRGRRIAAAARGHTSLRVLIGRRDSWRRAGRGRRAPGQGAAGAAARRRSAQHTAQSPHAAASPQQSPPQQSPPPTSWNTASRSPPPPAPASASPTGVLAIVDARLPNVSATATPATTPTPAAPPIAHLTILARRAAAGSAFSFLKSLVVVSKPTIAVCGVD